MSTTDPAEISTEAVERPQQKAGETTVLPPENPKADDADVLYALGAAWGSAITGCVLCSLN
jgi:hypothetical protein